MIKEKLLACLKVRLWGAAADIAMTWLGYLGKLFRSTVLRVFADQSALQDEHGDSEGGEDEGPGDQPQLDDLGDSGDRFENGLDEVQQDPQQISEAQQPPEEARMLDGQHAENG